MLNNQNDKLLAIGNGFDLHLKLKSKFTDFFNSIDNKDKNILYGQGYEFDLFGNFLNKISDFNISSVNKSNPSNYDKEKAPEYDMNPVFRYITQFVNMPFLYKSEFININKDKNFWNIYFNYLKYFPNFDDNANVPIKDLHGSSINREFNNWMDIEYQISFLLKNTENLFIYSKQYMETFNEHYDEIVIDDTRYQIKINEGKNYYSQILNDMNSSTPQITYKGAWRLLILCLVILCGWNTDQNIYNFLYKELQNFEDEFKHYIANAFNNISDYYDKNARQFALNLVNENDSNNYNLINFNYTTFYDLNDDSKENVHSTFIENSHPIFGIGDSFENGNTIFNKPYHRFSKTHRIMKLANNKHSKNVLTNNIKEIVFYGQSLSSADYSYFETIFDHYDIYDNNGISLIFKYTELHSEEDEFTSLDKQIESVYNLINKYGHDSGNNNLLHKLLMESRLSFQEVPDNSK